MVFDHSFNGLKKEHAVKGHVMLRLNNDKNTDIDIVKNI